MVEKWVLNPGPKLALRLGIAPKAYALLETTGRKTGRARRTPIAGYREGSRFWWVAEHGGRAAYVRNLEANPRVRVKVRRKWHTGTASTQPDDDPEERRREFEKAHGLIGRLDSVIFRANATNPMTVRIDLDGEADR